MTSQKDPVDLSRCFAAAKTARWANGSDSCLCLRDRGEQAKTARCRTEDVDNAIDLWSMLVHPSNLDRKYAFIRFLNSSFVGQFFCLGLV